MGVFVNEAGTMAYGVGSASLIRTNAMGGTTALPKKMLPTSPEKKILNGGDLAPWGDGNDFPQQVRAEAEKNTILPGLLEFKAKA